MLVLLLFSPRVRKLELSFSHITLSTCLLCISAGKETSWEIWNGLEENVLEEDLVVKDVVEVVVGVQEVVREVPDAFLSLALSPRLMQRGWLNFNTRSDNRSLCFPWPFLIWL